MTSSLTPLTPQSPPLHPWRIGLFITSIVLGILLVVFGVLEWNTAKQNGLRITQAQVMYMMMGFQKQLRERRSPQNDISQSLYETFRDEGVHRVAVYEHDTLLHEFGESTMPFRPGDFDNGDELVEIHFVSGELVHAKISLPQRFPPPGRGWRFYKHNPQHPPHARSFFLELTPKEAITLRDRALRMMLLNIIAAIILMGAAVVFWKQSVRQEKLERQLEKDRQLKALGQMSAVIGHELKNTIATVKGHAQLLSENVTDAANAKSAALISQEALYLQELTAQMLEFARTGELKPEKVYLDDLAEAAVTFSKTDQVTVTLDTHSSTAVIDRHKLQQVLTNIINNAHEAGSTEISMHIQNSGELRITIRDNGPGIDVADQEKIFDPFFTTRAKGTGLGLALAKRVVESHAGYIELTSKKGKGSTFTMHIPNHSVPLEVTAPTEVKR